MADIRIKDLTTLESASLTGDVFVIDGTTGTRKLSAFSPSFGGNATVTGTLSSAGNLSVTGTSAQVILGQSSGSQLTYLIRSAQAGGAIQIVQDSATVNRWLSLGRADNSGVYVESMRLNDAGVVSISATTASTTTSSGALVVGNGTSGGLGVGGAVTSGGGYYFGASADAALTRVSAGVIALGGAATSRIDINGATDVGIGFRQTGVRDWFVAAKSAELQTSCLSAGSIASYESGVLVRVRDTTASTGTSSGALVVSGGVGVAKRIFTGEGLDTAGDNSTHISFVRNGTVSIGPDSTATPALVISTSIQTSAPSGGTAAKWKLGTVASVSPTSPNRTIEVEIGGTTYYLHAKTTNN